jgi:hypothetical protein
MCRWFYVLGCMHKDGYCSVIKLLVKNIFKSASTLISFVPALFEILCPRVHIVYFCIVN